MYLTTCNSLSVHNYKALRPLEALLNLRQMCEQAKSGAVARRRGVKREANLPACGASLTSEKNSPLYGVQHRRDTLWKCE
jgi:hypothetical protein